MNFFVAVTDYDWFLLHASKPGVEEVNFWRPSPTASFKALGMGEMLLFKLHAPRNFIVGGGFFTRFVQLPISLAWESFGEGNGVRSLSEMRDRIATYRRSPIGPMDNPSVGCILLAEPFFFSETNWIPIPSDFSLNIVQGKGYSSQDASTGEALWRAVTEGLSMEANATLNPGPATIAAVESRYGPPTLVRPRLGQGAFRVIVTEVYERRCAITGERTLPVLEAAQNGLLLRSDVHTLFDQGYMTVDAAELKVVVSGRIREEFENGEITTNCTVSLFDCRAKLAACPHGNTLRSTTTFSVRRSAFPELRELLPSYLPGAARLVHSLRLR